MKSDNKNNPTLPTRLADNVWLLGNYYFNIFYVKGQKASALIEMGISATTETVIEQLGILDEHPDYLVITHPHADHITGLSGLKKKYPDASVVASHDALDFLTHSKAAEMMAKEDRYMTERLFEKGLATRHQTVYAPPDLMDCIEIHGNDEIDLGGTVLSFMPVKGHSPGNIAVHIPQGNVLIASDSLGFHYPGRGYMPLYFTGFEEYLDTIDRLATVQPDILGLGHQGPITGADVQTAFQLSKDSAVELKNSINESKGSIEILLQDLYRKFYTDELTIYSEENIRNCCMLLIKRVRGGF